MDLGFIAAPVLCPRPASAAAAGTAAARNTRVLFAFDDQLIKGMWFREPHSSTTIVRVGPRAADRNLSMTGCDTSPQPAATIHGVSGWSMRFRDGYRTAHSGFGPTFSSRGWLSVPKGHGRTHPDAKRDRPPIWRTVGRPSRSSLVACPRLTCPSAASQGLR